MANLATVKGSIELEGPIESINAFLRFKEIMENWYYDTSLLLNEKNMVELYKLEEKNPQKEDTVVVFFEATGRWSYMNNIENFIQSIESERPNGNESLKNDWTVQNELDRLLLERQPITITFDYYEIETGMDVLNQSCFRIELIKNNFLEPNIIESYITDYDLNAKNIHHLDENFEAFEYSSYTVKDIDEHYDHPDFQWSKYIHEHIDNQLDVTDIDDIESKRHNQFIQQLGQELDTFSKENPNYKAIWFDIIGWFNDEVIQNAIAKTLTSKEMSD